MSGSREWRLSVYSTDRLVTVTDVFGQERMTVLTEEVTDEFRKTLDPASWHVFTNGTSAEWAAHADQVYRSFEQCDENPIEVRVHLPEDGRAKAVVLFLCSRPVGDFGIHGIRARYATREEAEDFAHRLSVLRIPDLRVEIVTV
jgi:hypothetical protein